MSKTLFKAEFDINASSKMLYSYISTASGLAQWFADDVTLDEDKNFNFIRFNVKNLFFINFIAKTVKF